MTPFASQRYPLNGVVNTRQGGRKENQDDCGFVDTPLGALLVVCDGMGGGPGGKTASYIAKCEFMTALYNSSPQASPVDALKMAVSRANDAIYRQMELEPALCGMGSTLVAVLVNEQSALVVHLGDSRCYRVHGGMVVFRTIDHSLVGEMVQNQTMTEEQARLSPQSNVIKRALGATSNHVPEIEEVPYCRGDRFVLCTDGVWGIMPHEQLVERLISHLELGTLADRLSAEVDQMGFSRGGGHDNHTLAIVEVQTDSKLKDKMSNQLKIALAALTTLLVVSLVFNVVGLVRSGSGVQVDELRQQLAAKEREVENLKSSLAMYTELKDAGSTELIKKMEILAYENELLGERVEELLSEVDSLKDALAKAQQSKPVAAAQKGDAPKQDKVKKAEASVTVADITGQILANLQSMKNCKAGTEHEATQQKVKCRQEVMTQLAALDRKTEGRCHDTIVGIKKELADPPGSLHPSTALLVMRNAKNTATEEYISTLSANKRIDAIVEKVKEIVSKYK
ncbi:MAG: protein phosphatase 2C domain-containing protein [Bacteroidaceae bacterium]|nr:protein phosphatase 2C domain-containing protein [Bacteroidaceae bacterium]